MTDKEKLLSLLEEEMLPKIYGFCRLKVSGEQDAEDLAQEICLEIVKSIHSGKKIENLNAFTWSVSNHLYFNWLRKKKYGSTAYLPDIFASGDDPEQEIILREQTQLLRRELSLLSECYRKSVILFYFEEKSCAQIGQILGKSSGTVKWWLHEAKKAIEKGMNEMREYGEKSYRPGTLAMSCQGNPGANLEPVSCAKRKSAQNILLAAYKKPMSIEDLCIELGISAPYIEDEVDYLVKNQLMTEVAKDRYQTDFVILPGSNVKVGHQIYAEAFPAYFDKLIAFLNTKKEILTSECFNLAGFSWDRLLWVYIHIITDIAVGKYKFDNRINVSYENIPNRPNGGKWIALGFEQGFFFQQVEFEEYLPYDGPVHKPMAGFVQSFFHHWSGPDSSVFFDTPDEVFNLCRAIIKCEKSADQLNESEQYLFSIALEKKLFLRDGDNFRPNYYFVKRAEREEIEKMAREFYSEVAPIFAAAYDIVLKEYRATVPKHLHWQMGNFLSNYLNLFVTCSLYEAKNHGLLSEPDDQNRYWLSLFASE